ncbi:hypothetical protein NQ314_016229 [Rhamnusium bicolor]|uniref:MADF domain-containing protein n=1 Tax=Rhamnusium bicolor TaxID=1586634 RepID=A0AAV8WXG7_9CUCU|nr:hypothetical protein NQ314_016229 [Rhamnusium bicolor]
MDYVWEKKVWTIEEIGILIDAYREHRNLWDPRNFDYKNRIKKMDSYKEIAGLFDTSSEEVERKVKKYHFSVPTRKKEL